MVGVGWDRAGIFAVVFPRSGRTLIVANRPESEMTGVCGGGTTALTAFDKIAPEKLRRVARVKPARTVLEKTSSAVAVIEI